MPKTVLREQFEDAVIEEDEGAEPDYDVDYDSVDNALRENHVYSESPRLAVAGGRTNGSAPAATQESGAKEGEEFKGRRLTGVHTSSKGWLVIYSLRSHQENQPP